MLPVVAAIPLSLYVHIPWCVRKCPYCDFNSHARPPVWDEAGYVTALLADLDRELPLAGGREIRTVFIGGGTPSLFSAQSISDLLDGLAARSVLNQDAEITLEANPGTLEAGRYRGYRKAGVNRLSLGVQSLNDECLQALGRIHSAADARAAFASARAAGFDNINIDLMHGLPAQTLAEAMLDLHAVFELQPEHLSWYQLTLEPNTPFHHRPPPLPDDDALADITEHGQALLAQAGYGQYEISAYARAGRRCRHNLNYWAFGDYLGIGAGAHAKLTQADGRILRRSKSRGPQEYRRGNYLSTEIAVPRHERALEFMLNALRLNEGVAAELFHARTGLPCAEIAAPLAIARARGLMEPGPTRLAASELGRRFLNELLILFDSEA